MLTLFLNIIIDNEESVLNITIFNIQMNNNYDFHRNNEIFHLYMIQKTANI